MKKTLILISILCVNFLNAYDINDTTKLYKSIKNIVENIKKAKYDIELISTYGDVVIKAPRLKNLDANRGPRLNLISRIEQNKNDKAFQNKLSKLKKQHGDFCGEFYDDLLNYKNIQIKEPVAKNVQYHDKTFKENMGSCYYIGMDWFFDNMRHDGNIGIVGTSIMHKPLAYTLYKTSILGENNLFLIQKYLDPRYKPSWYEEQRTEYTGYILNDEVCKKALAKDYTDFNMIKDRDSVILKRINVGSAMDPDDDDNYNGLIIYKNKEYHLSMYDGLDSDEYYYAYIHLYDYLEDGNGDFTPKCEKQFFN